jgi:hypothetical protein
MCHHILIQVGHDYERPSEHQDYDEHPERESEDIIGVVGSGGNVKEEHQVYSHLGDGKNNQTGRYTRGPEDRGVRHPEGRDRQNHGATSKPIV